MSMNLLNGWCSHGEPGGIGCQECANMARKQVEINSSRATILVSNKIPDLDKFKEQAKKYNWRLLIDDIEWKPE